MLIGRGRCAEIRALSDDEVLKLYEPRFSLEQVEGYAEVGQRVHAAGIQTPAIKGVRTEGNRSGVVMERVYGTTLWEAIRESDEPAIFGRQIAELHAKVHAYKLSDLTSKLDEVSMRVDERAAHSPAAVEIAHQILETGRGEEQVLIHSDLHPANLMVNTDGEMISIDWDAAQEGPAVLDVARAYLLIADWAVAPGTDPVDPWVRHAVADAYLASYVEMTEITRDEIETWFLPLSLARYCENAVEDIPILDALVHAAESD